MILLLGVLFCAFQASALGDGRFVVQGIGFSCEACRVLPEGDCRIEYSGEVMVVPCENALDYLLRDALSHGDLQKRLKEDELLRFLLRKKRNSRAALMSMRLLFRTVQGRKLVRTQLEKLYEAYPGLFEEFVSSGVLDEADLSLLWAFSRGGALAENARLRVKIAVADETIGLRDLVEELQVDDPASAVKTIQVYEEILRLMGRDEALLMKELQDAVSVCLEEYGNTLCEGKRKSLPAYAAAYLERIRIQSEIETLRRFPFEPKRRLRRIARLSFEQYRTPALHREVRGALEQMSGDEAAWILREPYLSMLAEFSRNDSGIKQELGRIIKARAAYTQEQQHRISQYFDLVAPQEDSKRTAVRYYLVLGVCVLGTGIYLTVRRRRRALHWEISRLSTNERAELRELRSYFSLGPRATSEELKREYHRRAKKSHPDAAHGSSAEFRMLRRRYERAKTLLESC